MRLTVKAKLASAFGAVLALSMLTSGIAYVKMTGLTDTIEVLSSRIQRMDWAGDMKTFLTDQVRAEKSLLLSGDDGDIAKIADGIPKIRADELQRRQQIYDVASPSEKESLDSFLTE